MRTPSSPSASADTLPDEPAHEMLYYLTHGGVIGDFLDMEPAEYEALYALGHHFYAQQQYASALEVFGHLVLHNHRERRYLMAYAAALQMNREWAAAVTTYATVSLLDLRDPLPGFHACECLIQLGLRNEAREGLALVIRQCGNAHAAVRDRAAALVELLSLQPSPHQQENTSWQTP